MSKDGELKGKDKQIENLNINIKDLQQQLGALRDCHNHDNPLQSIVDTLTAKNQKLEAELKSLQA